MLDQAIPTQPDLTLSARELFKIDTDLQVPAFSVADVESIAARIVDRARHLDA